MNEPPYPSNLRVNSRVKLSGKRGNLHEIYPELVSSLKLEIGLTTVVAALRVFGQEPWQEPYKPGVRSSSLRPPTSKIKGLAKSANPISYVMGHIMGQMGQLPSVMEVRKVRISSEDIESNCLSPKSLLKLEKVIL